MGTASEAYRAHCDIDWDNEIELVDDIEEFIERKLKALDLILNPPVSVDTVEETNYPKNLHGRPIPPPPAPGKMRNRKPVKRKNQMRRKR